ncbi:hypothetical protein [Leptolyngbya sp. O-77]|uniref:hypothetical protein n=1 Tax=Leptolyngbya sp. O-77 TaxID=1080068 RepID=UPI00074D3369|nr:hypothetical protein [Leptolyngbya sp. O-77]BAU40322.1 hypothetical protein O77CONTIG1_00119 [Leptolyngbya sp. O-77]
MIIAELNYLETVAEAGVQGGTFYRPGRNLSSTYTQDDKVSVRFDTTNRFETVIKAPGNVHNISASAGAKGDAIVRYDAYSFTKADTLAVVDDKGNSFSLSTSAALINW